MPLNLFVLVLAIVDVCHLSQYYEQVVEGLERSKCFLPDSYRNLLFWPSSPFIPHLATMIICVYSKSQLVHNYKTDGLK
jgi:hypothetical protein